MLVVKKTGLVPVRALSSAPPYNTGEVFGLPPDKARAALAAGTVRLEPIPDGVETIEVQGPVQKAKAEAKPPGEIEIPEGWQEKHHLVRLKLATAIFGGELPEVEGKKPLEVADEIILAEIKRRAAPPQE